MEDQQAQAASSFTKTSLPLTPDELDRERRRQGLTLFRKHVLQQLTVAQNPQHRQMLENAVADLDAKLAQLG